MTGNEYQQLAARTINKNLDVTRTMEHSLFGMCSEIGELLGIYQKVYQGHALYPEHIDKELGDILWMVAEYCTATGRKLDDIMELNIQKLRDRYPEGFDSEHSLHRKENDI
jgi:NTP pyrophosphatase (non-canonical NTP hydrolase)